MITFRFSTEEAPVIVTRVGETGQQESLENVLVMVFDKDGKLVNKAYQQLTIDNHSVNIYLTPWRINPSMPCAICRKETRRKI